MVVAGSPSTESVLRWPEAGRRRGLRYLQMGIGNGSSWASRCCSWGRHSSAAARRHDQRGARLAGNGGALPSGPSLAAAIRAGLNPKRAQSRHRGPGAGCAGAAELESAGCDERAWMEGGGEVDQAFGCSGSPTPSLNTSTRCQPWTGVDLDLDPRKFSMVVLGTNGSGKSTLLGRREPPRHSRAGVRKWPGCDPAAHTLGRLDRRVFQTLDGHCFKPQCGRRTWPWRAAGGQCSVVRGWRRTSDGRRAIREQVVRLGMGLEDRLETHPWGCSRVANALRPYGDDAPPRLLLLDQHAAWILRSAEAAEIVLTEAATTAGALTTPTVTIPLRRPRTPATASSTTIADG